MKRHLNLITLTWATSIVWCGFGVYLFLVGPPDDRSWTTGELGDFFGGGLGGLAIISLLYTASLQGKQLEKQRLDMEEAGLLRTFEALRPEAEGLSMRIIAKLVDAKLVGLSFSQFQEMSEKYRGDGDRTVFLRAMQKLNIADVLRSGSEDPEVQEALSRFRSILKTLDESLKELEKDSGRTNDFCNALRSTELFHCYTSVFRRESSNIHG